MVEVRAEIRPPGPYRLPGPSAEGLVRRRGDVLFRLLRVEGHDVLLRAAQRPDGTVVAGARVDGERPAVERRAGRGTPGRGPVASSSLVARGDPEAAAREALRRWRFALGCDLDLRPFLAAHRHDPLIGDSLRRRPWLRPARRPSVFEALLCAVCEQLIAFEDAVVIQRRVIARFGTVRPPDRPSHPLLREAPDAAVVAGRLVPADFESCGLAPGRAATVHRAARELDSGRIDGGPDADHARLLARLGRLPGVGSWTLALVATQALGRVDLPPSGDLGLVKALGRIRTGDPRARVAEAEVDAWLAPYAPWGALAAAHLLSTRPDTLPTAVAA